VSTKSGPAQSSPKLRYRNQTEAEKLAEIVNSLPEVYLDDCPVTVTGTNKESTMNAQVSKLVDFGIKKIEAIGEELSKLIHPAIGNVTWYNDTDEAVSVKTFDEQDAVRWVSYETRTIAPRQVVELTARGELIHIKVDVNGCTYDCRKGNAYLFDGKNVHLKK
jgi:hypothetical protein